MTPFFQNHRGSLTLESQMHSHVGTKKNITFRCV
jgi:hypothetical protein